MSQYLKNKMGVMHRWYVMVVGGAFGLVWVLLLGALGRVQSCKFYFVFPSCILVLAYLCISDSC